MLNKELIIKRLSLIKYLYKIGLDQSHQSETIGSFSVLSFHDSIEMFLKLYAEHRNERSEQFDFMKYWEKFPELTLKESMRNLNERRKNIKHRGILLSKSDIEICRVNTTEFFEQNTHQCFDIEFKAISLFSLINKKSIREYLYKAQDALNMGKNDESITYSAVSFHHLIYLYEKQTSSPLRESPFSFGSNMFYFMQSSYTQIDSNLDHFIQEAAKAIESLQMGLKIVGFGIDYKRFAKFQLLTPIITRMVSGKYFLQIWKEKQWSKENCQYCIDFVLDSCLKLQEFDFDIKKIENKEVLDYYSFSDIDEDEPIILGSFDELKIN